VEAANVASLRWIAVPNHLTRHRDLSAGDLNLDSLVTVGFAGPMKRFGSMWQLDRTELRPRKCGRRNIELSQWPFSIFASNEKWMACGA
jgi:hypothetical protein